MNNRITSLKKEVKNKTKGKSFNPMSKLKININDDIEKNIVKIYKYLGKQYENDSEYSQEDLKSLLTFNNFKVDLICLSDEISKNICSSSMRLDTIYPCYTLEVTSIYNYNFTASVSTVLGAKLPTKTEKFKYYSINPEDKWQYYRILDFNTIIGYLKMLDMAFDYYFNHKEYYSFNGKTHQFKDSLNIINLEVFTLLNINKKVGHTQALARRINFLNASELILDAILSITYEENRLFLMRLHEEENNSNYAKSYETKKNIPKIIEEKMRNTSLLKDFSFVELDESTDLEKFRKIEKEYLILRDSFNFPNLIKKKPEIRFRRLGKLRALGAYYSGINCICIDVNSPSSFMHEFAHFIDYTYSDEILSLKNDFSHIGIEYSRLFMDAVSEIPDGAAEKKYLKRKIGYFTTPTEIFARSFEIYLYEKQLNSSFCKVDKSEFTITRGFPEIPENLKSKIIKYFDGFIEIKDFDLKALVEKSKDVTLFDFKSDTNNVIFFPEEEPTFKGIQLSLI